MLRGNHEIGELNGNVSAYGTGCFKVRIVVRVVVLLLFVRSLARSVVVIVV
jgi:hypothetical protein